MLGVAMLLVGASSLGETKVTVTPDSTVLVAPTVEIVVYDGTSLPATVVAGCSEPDCLGYSGPLTGTVTHLKNYVGWGVGGGDSSETINLYVDGKRVDSARWGHLLLWNTRNLLAGPHTLVATTHDSAGVEGSSTPLTITVVK